MTEYITVQEAADELGKDRNNMYGLLNEGRIQGARKSGWEWQIPRPVVLLPPSPTRDEGFLSVQEAADELGKGLKHLYSYLLAERIQGAHKVNGEWQIPSPVVLLPPPSSLKEGFLSVQEAADELGVSPDKMGNLCREGLVIGAYKEGWFWQIPNPVRLRDSNPAEIKAGYVTVAQARHQLGGLSHQQVSLLCKEGLLIGAEKNARGHWIIPTPIQRKNDGAPGRPRSGRRRQPSATT